MRPKLLTIFPFVIILFINCEEENETDSMKTFGGSGDDWGYCVQQTTDGAYIIIGSTSSFDNGSYDVWLIKTDSNGNKEWNKTLGSKDRDEGFSGQQTTDGGFIITGYTLSFGISGVHSNYDMRLFKTDSEGNEEWNKTLGSGIAYSVQQTVDGGYIIAGSMLVKTDANGNEEWSKPIEGESVQQTTDNGYIITGSISYGIDCPDNDYFLIKTDSIGNEEWNKTLGTGVVHFVQQTADGGFIITGFTGTSNMTLLLFKTDSDGNEEWNRTFGGNGNDSGQSVQQTTDGGFIVTGSTSSFGNGSQDVWLIKTDSSGNEEWRQTFGGDDWDSGHSVQETSDGGYIISGVTSSFGFGGNDVLLIKTYSNGNSEWE